MTYFVMGEITLKTDDWIIEYVTNINSFIEKHGGNVLSRSLGMESIEGERALPTNVILIEFPCRESALSFFKDPDYQPLRQLRRTGSISEFIMFPAEDLANAVGIRQVATKTLP